jgi:uncharacterized membrane protein HdeD (DUF308 family)
MPTPDSSAPRRSRIPSTFWTGPFVMGVLVSLVGLGALGSVILTSLVSALFYSGVLMVAGVLEISHGLRHRDTGPSLLFVLGGLLSLLAGGFLLTQPHAGLVALTLLIAAYFLASGFFRLVTAGMDRHPGFGWDLAQGAVSVLLGAFIFSRMPTSSWWVLGLVVGVEIFTRGLSLRGARGPGPGGPDARGMRGTPRGPLSPGVMFTGGRSVVSAAPSRLRIIRVLVHGWVTQAGANPRSHGHHDSRRGDW